MFLHVCTVRKWAGKGKNREAIWGPLLQYYSLGVITVREDLLLSRTTFRVLATSHKAIKL